MPTPGTSELGHRQQQAGPLSLQGPRLGRGAPTPGPGGPVPAGVDIESSGMIMRSMVTLWTRLPGSHSRRKGCTTRPSSSVLATTPSRRVTGNPPSMRYSRRPAMRSQDTVTRLPVSGW